MPKKSATGVMNGNFRSGEYYRYAQEVSKYAPELCPKCGDKKSLPMYLVGKTDLCYGCYEEEKHELKREAEEIASDLEWVGEDLTPNPKYHVSKEWAKRHLTLDPIDLDKAFGAGNWVLS